MGAVGLKEDIKGVVTLTLRRSSQMNFPVQWYIAHRRQGI